MNMNGEIFPRRACIYCTVAMYPQSLVREGRGRERGGGGAVCVSAG